LEIKAGCGCSASSIFKADETQIQTTNGCAENAGEEDAELENA